ncbi:hypothetical protein Y032_0500g2575 [Ancylostoma ceylanicum]|nr:hypothetical protein Y032_0500g2575 [Ancylostoma ceylanicum]
MGEVHFIYFIGNVLATMSSYNFPLIVNQSRTVQLCCLLLQVILTYINVDYMGMLTFIFTMAICLYNLYITGRRMYNNIDGRFDLRQMVRESDTQLKLLYASEVFTPPVLGIIVFLVVRLPGSGKSRLPCLSAQQARCQIAADNQSACVAISPVVYGRLEFNVSEFGSEYFRELKKQHKITTNANMKL